MPISAWYGSRLRLTGRPTRRSLVVSLGLALGVGLLPQYAPQADAQGLQRPELQDTGDPVRGMNAENRPHPKNPAKQARVTSVPAPRWPKATTADLAVGAGTRAAAGTAVRVGRPAKGGKAAAPESVRVRVYGRKAVEAAGIDGVLLDVRRSDGGASQASVGLTFDYAGFADAYGGGYGSRLTLVQYPACLLTEPGRAECNEPTELKAANDTEKQALSADVTAYSRTDEDAPLLAAVAGEQSDQGDYGATPLQASAEWSVSNSSGVFDWSYPLRTPPTPGGLSPTLALGYNSQSVDGKTAATNGQGSWAGLGFSYEPGFIERRYKGCAQDGHSETNGDNCWAYDNATIQLAGGPSGELIKDDASGAWRISTDDNSRVQKKTGAPNGDDNGEYWVLTSTDGTEYYFGLDNLPGYGSGDEQTNSAWTMPVYGDDAGEPCYDPTLADAHCNQAWRWNLDYVKDRHGNVMSFFYNKETNYYTQGLKTEENGKPYTRGGYLKRIDYGQRDGRVYSEPAAARVKLNVAERCIGTAADCEPGDLNDDTAERWPDVPWDRNCKAGTQCKGQNSPTFWTRKKLTHITTQIRAGTGYRNVESWKLSHLFTDNGDSSRSLWLHKIDHSGHVGGTATMPSVELLGQQLPNRVDVPGDNIQAMNRYRLSGVDNDTGGLLDIRYAGTECTADNLPGADSSTKRCYPVTWNPPGAQDPITDWFHKHVVGKVVEADLSGGATDMVTAYDYRGGAGWKTPKPDGISDPEYRTKSDWRGYGKVRVTKSGGTVSPANTRTEHTFLRGLGGTVTDSEGGTHTDSDRLSGHELETVTYDGGYSSDKVVSKSITTAWSHNTATRTKNWGTSKAWYVRPATTRSLTRLEDGTWQVTRSTTRYDAATGRETETDDYGEVGVGDDNLCIRTSYADNTAAHMLAYLARVEKVSVSCGATPDRRSQVVSDDLTLYDGKAVGEAPTKGDVTKVRRLASHDGSTPTYETVTATAAGDFDAFGRPLKVTDAEGSTTQLAYAHKDGLATSKTETNALGWETVTEFDPAWGQPAAQIDPNGKRTDLGYDPLGRLTGVWMPDRPKSSDFTPSIRYTYLVRKGAPTAVKTEKIENDGVAYGTEYTLYDGLLRPRQEQTEGPEGGRMVADIIYDGLGNVARTYGDYYTTGAPSDQLFEAVNGDVDAQTFATYDGAGRKTADIFKVAGEEKWRTTYTHGGDRVHTDPPPGQAPTTVIADARGRTSEIRRYKGDAPQPDGGSDAYESIRYRYDAADRLTEVTDQAGNTWTYGYDQRGRRVSSDDPDTGRTTFGYDTMDRRTSATDARGKTTSTVYDAIGRTVSTWQGQPDTGTKLTQKVYDRLAKNTLYGSYRYDGGQVLTATLDTQLDGMYQPTKTVYAVGGTAPEELHGSYEYRTEYNNDGTIAGTVHPAAGGLPAEGLAYDYDDLQRPVRVETTLSAKSYVPAARYSPTSLLQQLELGVNGGKKTWLTYEYERGTDRLTNSRVDREGAAAVTYDADYAYDPSGNITAVADTPTEGAADVQCFDYDWQRRLVESWSTTNPSDGTAGSGETNGACANGPASATVGGPAAYWQSFTYDTAGNRSRQTLHGTDGAADTTRSFTYGEGDAGPHQLTSVTTNAPATRNEPAVTSLDTYRYDEAGNTAEKVVGGDTQHLTWNAEGRLASATDAASGAESTYRYDATGTRLLRNEPGTTTLYLPGMELRLDESSNAVTGLRYYSLGGQTVALRTTEGVQFLAADHHGTAEIAVDALTGETTRRRMDPFGKERGTADTPWIDDKGFLGKPQDESTGLTHIGAREYEPENGRFISADPLIDFTDPQQINGYAYSNNSPVTFSDPTGEMIYDEVSKKGFGTAKNLRHYIDANPARYRALQQANARNYWKAHAARAQQQASRAQQQAAAAKSRAIDAAKELAAIADEELGITTALDCFTTGSLGACGETALNVVTTAFGGAIGKLAKKYALPWNWKKGADLAKKIWSLLDTLQSNVRSWTRRSSRADDLADEAVTAAHESAENLQRLGCNSFTPGTGVLMADGTTQPIEDIEIGDKVLATDPETGETTTEKVTAEIEGEGTKNLVRITLDTDGDKDTKTATVTATDGHPFWVPELGEWIEATDLHAGQWLRTGAGTRVQITAVERWTTRATVHNLTVTDKHTYHVLAGATPVLVHNATPGQKCDLTLGAGPNAREGVALENGDIEADGVRDMINESGNAHGCHTCDAATPGTKDGDWIPDHQPPSSLVTPGSPQTAYPHCLPCARSQGGVVSQLSQGKSKKEW